MIASVNTCRPADLAVLLLFLAAMAYMGWYLARKRNNNSEDFFLGGRSLPGWAVGLSMAGTALSSVTFLALPAATYVLDMRYVMQYAAYPLVILMAIFLFIPFFRKSGITSAYEYLENRFGLPVRLYTSASFIIMQQIRLAAVLYLMALPVAHLTGIPVLWVIFLCGIAVMLYSGFGGMTAVVWTDVVQTIILFAGAFIIIGGILADVPGGLNGVIEQGSAAGKFSLGPRSFGLGERTMFVMVLAGFTTFLSGSIADQTVVQRYLAASSTFEARKAAVISAVSCMFTWGIFLFLGVALFVWVKNTGDAQIAKLTPEEVLPYYILHRIPQGIAGVIITAVIAAAMSTLSSGINSNATVCVVDFIRRCIAPGKSDAYYLKCGKYASFASGIIMIAGAAAFHFLPRESMTDLTLIIGSLFGGCTLAIFLAVFFCKRINSTRAMIGIAGALVCNVYCMLSSFKLLPEKITLHIHSYLVILLVNAAFFVFAALPLPKCLKK